MQRIIIATMFVSSLSASVQAAAGFTPWNVAHPSTTERAASVPTVGFAPWSTPSAPPAGRIEFEIPRLSFHGFGPWVKPGV